MNDLEIKMEQARQVKQRYQESLLKKANVLGIGIGYRKIRGENTRQVALVVMVRQKLPVWQVAPDDLLPHELDGVPLDVQEIGEPKAL